MSSDPDWTLVERARQGDDDAFEELVARYEKPVIHFCYRMVGSREDAEDLAQETFVRLYGALKRLKPKAQFSTVLFAMTRNATLNHVRNARRRGRGNTRSLSGEGDREMSVPDVTRQPDRAARLAEIENALQVGLARLSPKLREVLLLREFQGYDYETIGRIVRCRRGTVKSRIARAREQLRLELLAMGGELL